MREASKTGYDSIFASRFKLFGASLYHGVTNNCVFNGYSDFTNPMVG